MTLKSRKFAYFDNLFATFVQFSNVFGNENIHRAQLKGILKFFQSIDALQTDTEKSETPRFSTYDFLCIFCTVSEKFHQLRVPHISTINH